MTDILFFNSRGELLFIIFTMIPILFYLIWRFGFNLGKVKILAFLSIPCAFYFYFTTFDLIFIFDQSLNIVIRNLFFFNLLFFSTIFMIIVLVIPSNQNTSNISQPPNIKEERRELTPLSDRDFSKNKSLSISLKREFDKERNTTKDKPEKFIEVLDEGSSNNKFQKLIDALFEDQNKE